MLYVIRFIYSLSWSCSFWSTCDQNSECNFRMCIMSNIGDFSGGLSVEMSDMSLWNVLKNDNDGLWDICFLKLTCDKEDGNYELFRFYKFRKLWMRLDCTVDGKHYVISFYIIFFISRNTSHFIYYGVFNILMASFSIHFFVGG